MRVSAIGTSRAEKWKARHREKRTESVQGVDQVMAASERARSRSQARARKTKRLSRSLQVARVFLRAVSFTVRDGIAIRQDRDGVKDGDDENDVMLDREVTPYGS